MTRGEMFVLSGRGHWAKARKRFRCEYESPSGARCLHTVEAGDPYLATDVPMYPNARERPYTKMKRRSCFACAQIKID